MADKEQLALLKAGVESWNAWRFSHPRLQINLRGADLHGAMLSEANLSGADLHEINLSHSNLSEADLSGANLREATLHGAALSGADLSRVSLCDADLSQAYLLGVQLSESDLTRAYLPHAHLRLANLKLACLHEANCNGVNLEGANLSGADLSRASFRSADLTKAYFIRAQVLGADFSQAFLTGACLKDWNTNLSTQMLGVYTDYVFLDFEYGQRSERRPHSGNFKPGEFAALFQQALDTLDLIFVDGIDWQSFFASFQELRQQYGDAEFDIQAIEKKSGGSFVVKLEVNEQADKAALQQSWDGIYEENQQLKSQLLKTEGKLEESREQLGNFYQKALQGMADQNQTIINTDFSGATIRGNVAGSLSGHAQQVYNEAPDKSLAEAAQEIQALLDQLSETYPTDTLVEKAQLATVAAEQAKANLPLQRRILAAVEAGTIGAIDQALSHPAATFFIEAVNSWNETKPQG